MTINPGQRITVSRNNLGLLPAAAGLFCCAALAGCCKKDPVPSAIEHAPPPEVVFDRDSHSLGARVVDQHGGAIPKLVVSHSAVPGTVLAIDASGRYSCVSDGDATVTLAGGGHSKALTVKCRHVLSVSAPDSLTLTLDESGIRYEAAAIDENSQPFRDVPVNVEIADTSVARLERGTLIPAAFGSTVVTASAGQARAVTRIQVRSKISTKSLVLEDGSAQIITLQDGSYVVGIDAAASSGHGVTVAWIGADCPKRREAQHHEIHCRVRGTATLKIENPTVFGLGGSAVGHINIYAVPE